MLSYRGLPSERCPAVGGHSDVRNLVESFPKACLHLFVSLVDSRHQHSPCWYGVFRGQGIHKFNETGSLDDRERLQGIYNKIHNQAVQLLLRHPPACKVEGKLFRRGRRSSFRQLPFPRRVLKVSQIPWVLALKER